MKLDNSFTIDASPEVVWSTLLDIERVAGCMPGAEVIGVSDDGGYDANVKVKIGPMAMTYRGSLMVAEQDDAQRRAVMSAKARELRGQGTAKASMVMSVLSADTTTVQVDTDMQVTGRVAQMGHGVMQDVANRLMSDFARNLADMIGADEAARDPQFDALPPQVPPSAADAARQPATGAPSGASKRAPEAIGALSLLRSVVRGRLKALLTRIAGPRRRRTRR